MQILIDNETKDILQQILNRYDSRKTLLQILKNNEINNEMLLAKHID